MIETENAVFSDDDRAPDSASRDIEVIQKGRSEEEVGRLSHHHLDGVEVAGVRAGQWRVVDVDDRGGAAGEPGATWG